VIILYRLVDGLWQALYQPSVTPPTPPSTFAGFGRSPFGSGGFGR
jgi:hypothetical protein